MIPITERSAWLNFTEAERPWLLALDAADRQHDKQPLMTLLKSNAKMSPRVRKSLADFIDRQVFRGHGKPRTPDYDLTLAEASMLNAIEDANMLMGKPDEDGTRRNTLPRAAAIEQAAEEAGIDPAALRAAMSGSGGHLARLRKRLG